ncbi:hypothetical protein CDIMF43_220027 [Carnobacterium divergens]|nr:hypothetical protein CDIMF43_220027 [Carnobacterium divergens]
MLLLEKFNKMNKIRKEVENEKDDHHTWKSSCNYWDCAFWSRNVFL